MNKIMTKSLCALLTVALLLPTGGGFAAATGPEVTVPQFVPPALSTEAPKNILAYSKGTELLKNANYLRYDEEYLFKRSHQTLCHGHHSQVRQ